MKCRDVRHHLSPYLDSELDPTTTYEISRHLEGCAGCALLFREEETLEREIVARLRRPAGDEEGVFERALAHALPAPVSGSRRRWLLATASGVAALSIVALRLGGGIGAPGSDLVPPELLAMVAEDHGRYMRGELVPELRAEDPARVAAFFDERRAEWSGALPSGEGWTVEGARVCRFQGVAVGFVTLRYRGTPVSVVDLRGDALGSSPESEASEARCFELAGGRGILRRTPFGLRAAFGDLDMTKLEEAVATGG